MPYEIKEWSDLTDEEQDDAVEVYIDKHNLSLYQTEDIYDLLANNYDYTYKIETEIGGMTRLTIV